MVTFTRRRYSLLIPINNQLTAHFVENNVYSEAIYSPCKNYRYSLSRTQLKAKKFILFILLNPSTATEFKNDPTIARCQKRSQLLGYEAFTICNLFAFRTKSPKIMKNFSEPIGPENNRIINEILNKASKVICAWGNHGTHLNQADRITKIIKNSGTRAYHLGLTKNNQPMHPLYIKYNKKLIKWF